MFSNSSDSLFRLRHMKMLFRPPPRNPMILGGLHHQSGMALGPILFIVAIIAILAAVIAAGSNGFWANTNTESAKAMAESIVTSCDDYTRAVQYMVMNNGCDITALDYTPNGGGWPTGTTWHTGDWTGGNGTNQAGNGQCALFDPRGGGMQFKPLPTAALASTRTGAYSTYDSSGNMDGFAGYPWPLGGYCFLGLGVCSTANSYANNGALALVYNYLNYQTCKQINAITMKGIDPNSSLTWPNAYGSDIFAGYEGVRSIGEYVQGRGVLVGAIWYTEGCGYDEWSNNGNSSYAFICPLYVR